MPELPVRKPKSFESAISVSPLSIYIGRIVYMPSAWKENGLVYVDVNDISGEIKKGTHGDDEGEELMKELENFGYRKAMLPRSFVMAANLWENPQEIYYKGSFAGSGSISISNYMFDPLTMTWITTVSTALNAIGVVNIPPVMVSLSETGIPSPPTSVNIGQMVDEAFSDALNSMTDPLSPNNGADSLLPSIDASDLVGDIKSLLMDNIGSSLMSGGGALKDMLSNGLQAATSVLPALKSMYGYDELLNKRDVLKQSLTVEESTILKKIDALERSAKEQTNALTAQTSAAIEQAKKKISEIIMGIVSPIVSKITSLYNEVVNSIRDKILKVISDKLKPPIQKVKKKLVRIVSKAITPIIEKLPMPARFIASIAAKKVLQGLIDKLVGFIGDAVKEALKKAFKYGKDKLVELLMKEFKSLMGSFLSSFSERSSVQTESKMEWIMTSELGDSIKALPESIKPYLSDMDSVYEVISEALSPSTEDMSQASSMLVSLLSATYDGLSITNKPSDTDVVGHDLIRNRRVSIYDVLTSSSFSTVSYTFDGSEHSSTIYNKTLEWLAKKLFVLSTYAKALEDPGKKPSEIVTELLETLPESMILSTTEYEVVLDTVMKAVEDAVAHALDHTRGLDSDILGYVCRMLGIDVSTVKYKTDGENCGLPYIDKANVWIPQWEIKSETHIKHTSGKHSHSVSSTEYTVKSEFGTYSSYNHNLVYDTHKACDLIASYVSELLASLYVLANGGVVYEKKEDNTYGKAVLYDREMKPIYEYKNNSLSYVHVDEETGYVYQVCPAFNVLRRTFSFNGNKKKGSRVSSSDEKTMSLMVYAHSLVSEEYITKVKPSDGIANGVYKSFISVNEKQAELLTRWAVFVLYPKGTALEVLFPEPVVLSVEICSLDEDAYGVRFYAYKDGNKVHIFREYLGSVFCQEPLFIQTNGYLKVEGLHYITTFIDEGKTALTDTPPVCLYECMPYGERNKHGVIEKYTYGNTFVDAEDVTVLCERIMWYEDELSDGVDMSAFFYVSPAIFSDNKDVPKCTPLVPTAYGKESELFSSKLPSLRLWNDTTKKETQIFGLSDMGVVHRACSELVFLTLDGESDKINARALLKDNAVRDIFETKPVYREPIATLMERAGGVHSSYSPSDSSSLTNSVDVTDGTKQRVYDKVISNLPEILKSSLSVTSLSDGDINDLTHTMVNKAIETLPASVSDVLMGASLSEEGLKAITDNLTNKVLENYPSVLEEYGLEKGDVSKILSSASDATASLLSVSLASMLSSVNLVGDWSKSWDGIEKKAKEVSKSVTDWMPDAVKSALSSVDFSHLNKIEPLLSDAQQKVMDRLSDFMEDVSIDTMDFANEFTDSLKQMMSHVGELASKVVDVQNIMDKVSSAMGAVKGAQDVLGKISELGDVAQKISDTFDSLSGSLDTSLVSSIGALVGPSMSISTSIGEYDMSLTEKPKCMKPYCYEIDDKSILNVGDIVLMMAVGNSTDHLYIIELPYKGQIV